MAGAMQLFGNPFWSGKLGEKAGGAQNSTQKFLTVKLENSVGWFFLSVLIRDVCKKLLHD